jgi:predicted nuclease of restriction endonuclease-like RecB superfamily
VLTADLVEVRRRGEALHLVAFEGERRALAEQLAAGLLGAARACVGESREDVDAALAAIDAPARARKLVLGLRKILEDASEWDRAATLDPETVRKAVFERAAAVRSALAEEARFDRDAVLGEVATAHDATIEQVEHALFADLRAAEILRSVDLAHPCALVERYASEQVQAVLLRAVSVRLLVTCDSPGAYRALFARIKFLRLLFTLRSAEDGAYELELDGPYSLFESVTKYGLQLALLVPHLAGARSYTLVADVRWGKGDARHSLRFSHEGGGGTAIAQRPLSDEAQGLLDDLKAQDTPWRARVSDAILELPGVGLCVPDLELVHKKTGEVVYVEVMGFWSRDAVFRRKALVEGGLPDRIVFLASSHLRVREELLPDDSTGALYVYKKVPSAKVLLERVHDVARRKVKRR